MAFGKQLERESARWVADGLLSEEQRSALLERHPPEDASRRLTTVLAWLGAALVVGGVILVVAVNWDDIPLLVRLGAGLALLVAAFVAGYALRFGRGYPKTGEALMLVGSGVFLADLALVSQQYHVEPSPQRLLLLLTASMVPLVYLIPSRAYAFLTPAVLAVWLGVAAADDASAFHVDDNPTVLFAGLGVAIVAFGVAHRFTRFANLAPAFEAVGVILLLGALFVLGFYRHWAVQEPAGAWGIALLIVLPAAIVVAVAALAHVRARARLTPRERLAALAATAVALGVLAWSLLAALIPVSESEEAGFPLWTAGFWLLFVAVVVCCAAVGLVWGREWLVNSAVAAVAVFVLARYFDLFSDKGFTGIAFVGAGLLVLVLAFALERARRALIGAAREERS